MDASRSRARRLLGGLVVATAALASLSMADSAGAQEPQAEAEVPSVEATLVEAELLIEQGHLAEAEPLLVEIVERDDGLEAAAAALLLAEALAQLAHHADAAARYEQLAEQHPDHARGPEALENAYLLRLGLGQTDEAEADLDRYEHLYRRRDLERAAGLRWSGHALLDTDEARRAHALDYLERYGNRGGVDRAIVAEAAIGQIDWRRSCPEPLLYDACVTVKRKRALTGVAANQAKHGWVFERRHRSDRFRPPRRCGSPLQNVVIVHDRDTKLAAAAQARFRRAIRLARKLDAPADARRARALADALAMAMLYRADVDYEQYLRVEVPADLDFLVEEWRVGNGVPLWDQIHERQLLEAARSRQRLAAHIEATTKLASELQARYAAVADTGSAAWTLAAAARAATIDQRLADQLYRAAVPQQFRLEEQLEALCSTLATYADRYQARAVAGYEACLARALELGLANAWSRACEAELMQIDPYRDPATSELFGDAIYSSSVEAVGVLDPAQLESM